MSTQTETRPRYTTDLTPAEFRAEWVENLRSGKFPQCRNALIASEKSCCLGVAARMLSPEADNGELAEIHITVTVNRYKHVSEALGFSPDQVDTLVELNDDKYLSFTEIADYVEQYFG